MGRPLSIDNVPMGKWGLRGGAVVPCVSVLSVNMF